MNRRLFRAFCLALSLSLAPAISCADVDTPTSDAGLESGEDRISFYVIPVRDVIARPVLFAIRNGVKAAIEIEADVLILDMDTPGGSVEITLEIMETLDRFPGKVVTYVNSDAVSAGAIISAVTDEIWFSQHGVIGASTPVQGGGEDIQEDMKGKVVSYLSAKVRTVSEDYPYRGQVISAMIDKEPELKIAGVVIKKEGETFSLTASEAIAQYGDPPESLLGEGIAKDLDALKGVLANYQGYDEAEFEVTWSLDLASFIVKLAPILLGLGAMAVYIEFKTPGFGLPGIAGITCFVVAIFGHHVAGLSGSEPMLLFLIGAALLFAEIFFFPGVLFMAVPGVILMVGSLVWSMTDIWPESTPGFEWTADMFVRPVYNLILGFLLGGTMILLLARFLPRSFIWDKMVLKAAIVTSAQTKGAEEEAIVSVLVGKTGLATSDLFPSGEIEVDGRRYEAHVSNGLVERGSQVKVVRRAQFGYEVEEVTA